MDCTDKIKAYIDEHMGEARKIHTYGVVDMAVQMARAYGIDEKKAEIAALCHDIYKGIHGDDINPYVREVGLSDKYLGNPNLAHSKIAAYKIPELFGITDEDIINAVAYHTTGRAGMSDLEKIIFVADFIEPGRKFPEAAMIREFMFDGLDKVTLTCLDESLKFLRSIDAVIDEDTVKAYEWLKGGKV